MAGVRGLDFPGENRSSGDVNGKSGFGAEKSFPQAESPSADLLQRGFPQIPVKLWKTPEAMKIKAPGGPVEKPVEKWIFHFHARRSVI